MSQPKATENFIQVNGINLHYITYESKGPLLVLLHGLSANAHAFDGLIKNGLNPAFKVVCPDLRGRGLSDHPAFTYSIADHAKDIIGLMDHLKADTVILGGHSFGGLLSYYMAATYPERISQLIIMDAAPQMNHNAPDMLAASLGRLNVTYPSFDAYIEAVKKAPYNTFWDSAMLNYYKADVRENANGTVRSLINFTDIAEVSLSVANTPWDYYVRQVNQPAILLNALDEYTLGEPMLPDEKAKDAVAMMRHARYIPVDGNHQTMLYGEGAQEIVAAIKTFVKNGK